MISAFQGIFFLPCEIKERESYTQEEWGKIERLVADDSRTSLGHFRFKDGGLVAETNSRERALRLEAKLKGHLPGLIVLEKTLYRQMDDLPRLSPEELDWKNITSRNGRGRRRRMLGLLPKVN